jgi:membrane protease YdiL (CAAX protease family)
MQQRLLERWPAWLAILTASLLFALMHVAPHAVIFAFPIGLYLGVLAWRTGSIWPCIACHAFINGSWNIYQLGTRLGYFPDPPPLAVLIGGAALIVGCFATTAWWITRGNIVQNAEPA